METLKVKTSELIAIRDETTQLLTHEKISFLTKFKVSNVYKDLVAKLESFESIRKEVIQKYGDLDEAKQNYVVPDEKKDDFQNEMKDLLDAEIEFQFEPLDISLIASLESQNVYYQIFKIFKG